MSEIKAGSSKIGMDGDSVHIWEHLKAGDHGEPTSFASVVGLHAQVTGHLGAATVVLQGSNVAQPTDGDWALLCDRAGYPIEFTTLDTFKVPESIARWVRPLVAGSDEATDVNVLLMVRGIS